MAAQTEAYALGGHLVTINDAAENQWVLRTVIQLYRNDVWLGYTDRAVEGQWRWISGQPPSYENWLPGEPNGGTVENYAVMGLWWQNGRWYDLNGDEKRLGMVEGNIPVARYEWNNPAGGQFNAPANWLPSGPPGSDHAAFFNRATTGPIVFDTSASSRLLVVSTSQVFDLRNNQYDLSDMYVANAAGENATLTLSSTHPSGGTLYAVDPYGIGYCVIGEEQGAVGTITVQSGVQFRLDPTLNVANYGRGTLNVQGGQVTAKAMVLGRAPGGEGTVNVVGASSTLQILPFGSGLLIGYDGTGTVNLSESGRLTTDGTCQIGLNIGSFGTVNVSGSGTRWVSNSSIWVGATGQGTLQIHSGGQVTTGGLAIGQWYLGRGTVAVEGPASRLTIASGALCVGENGDGSLTIADGGTVELLDGGNVFVGNSSTGTGQMLLTGVGSTFMNLREMWVGRYGCGMLTVRNGAGITANDVTVGAETGSMGTALVAGAGSQLTALDSMRIGAAGHGTLTISGGGRVEADDHIIVGCYAGGVGQLRVEGTGSRLDTPSMMVGMDDDAVGSVRITSGGRLNADDLQVGRSSNQDNTVLVSGPGSLLSATGLRVGASSGAKGKLLVADGGRVQCQWMRLGDQHTSAQGEATVRGSQSAVSVDGGVIIGGAGNGSVTVSNGGLFTCQWGATVGETPTSYGRLTVTGTESVYRVALGSMAVNNGKLEIRDGGRLELPGDGWLWVYDNSRIELAGGTIALAGELDLVSHAPEQARASLVGYGTVDGKVAGFAPLGEGIVARGGKLSLGTLASQDGFRFEGPVKVESDATLELLDQDLAFVWNHTVRLENGVLVARNGLQIDGASPALAGYGIVVGPVNHAIAAPAERVAMTQSLRVGSSIARVYSNGLADLGTRTEIFGGTLLAPAACAWPMEIYAWATARSPEMSSYRTQYCTARTSPHRCWSPADCSATESPSAMLQHGSTS